MWSRVGWGGVLNWGEMCLCKPVGIEIRPHLRSPTVLARHHDDTPCTTPRASSTVPSLTMDNSFEPEELFNALRIVKGMKTRYRQDVLEAYDNDLRKLKVQHISQNNQHSQTQSVAPANRLAIVYEGDDVARDSSWCPHRRLWVKPE